MWHNSRGELLNMRCKDPDTIDAWILFARAEEDLHSDTDSQRWSIHLETATDQLLATDSSKSTHATSESSNAGDYETFSFERYGEVTRYDDISACLCESALGRSQISGTVIE